MTRTPTREELGSRTTKIYYGLGSVAYGVKDHGFSALLLFFYDRVVGLPAFAVSLGVFIVLFFDAFIDPIIGQISDNLRTPLGRRHPLMYAAALPVAIGYYLLFTPPHASKQVLFFYLVAVAIVVRIFISLYEIPSSALAPEMTDDYDQRTSFLSYRYLFGGIGGVTMSFVTLRFLLRPDASHLVGQLNPAGYPLYAAVAAIVMIISILVSTYGTQRFIPLFRKPATTRPSLTQTVRDMATSLSHRPFVILIAAAVFGTTAIGLGVALNLYFATYFWELSASQIAILALTGILSAVFGPMLAGPISKRIEKRSAAILFYACFLCISPSTYVLRLIGFFPANGSPFLLPLLFLERSTSAILGVATLILYASMISDVVEDNAVRTGRRSEGLFFAGISFISKLLQGAGIVLAGLFASGLSRHGASAHVDPAAVRHLALLYLPTIVVLYGTGMLILSRYPITRAQHEHNLKRLSETMPDGAPAIDAAAAAKQVDFVAAKNVTLP
jgi:Na+/melibiose symporter-like transporter